jgi:CcmD family protein
MLWVPPLVPSSSSLVPRPSSLAAWQPATEEFVPVDQLPAEEQLPAAPLLVAAYAVVWIAVVGYLWSIWRRLQRVEAELARLAARTQAGEQPR